MWPPEEAAMPNWMNNVLILLGCVAVAALVAIVRGLFIPVASPAPQVVLFMAILVAAVLHRPFRGTAAGVFVAYFAVSGAIYLFPSAADQPRSTAGADKLAKLARQRIAVTQDYEACSTPCAELLLEGQVKTFIVDADTPRRGHHFVAYRLENGAYCADEEFEERDPDEDFDHTNDPHLDQDSPYQALGICFSATLLPAMPAGLVLKPQGEWNIGHPFVVSMVGVEGEIPVAEMQSGPGPIRFPLQVNVGFDPYAQSLAAYFPIEVMKSAPPGGSNLMKSLLGLEINGQIDQVPVDLLISHRGLYERIIKRGETGDQVILADLLGRTKGTFAGQDDYIRRLMANRELDVRQMAISAAARMSDQFPQLRDDLEAIAKSDDDAADWASDRLRVLAAGPEWRDML
jgi:hypothetical protein